MVTSHAYHVEDTAGRPLATRLRAAREARGLTQALAAAELGVSRPLLIAMEKGTREVSPGELVRLAEIYDVPVSRLVRPTQPPVTVGTRFRAALASSSRGAELSGLITELEEQADNYLDLLRRAGARLPGRPQPARTLDYSSQGQAGEDLATEQRNWLGLGDGPLHRLREILEIEVGLRIFMLNLPSPVAGLFVFVDTLGGCVGVNINHPAERRRWTMAHEYGHYLAHRDRAEVTSVVRQRRPPESERFADAFAANFLMPRSGLSRRVHELRYGREESLTAATLVQLAHAYGVSVQALTLRLEDLHLVPAGTWDWLSENNFRPRAAAELLGLDHREQAAEALPLYYRMLAVQLYADGEITEVQLARYLQTDVVSARRAYQELTASGDVSEDGSPQVVDLTEAVG